MHSLPGLRRYADLYGHFLRQQFKTMLEYRVSFVIGAGATVLQQAASLLTIWVVMRQVPSMQGWTLQPILLIYGLMSLSRSLNQLFTDTTFNLGGFIRSGAFDRFLVRPINPLFHLFATFVNVNGVGNLVVGFALVVSAGSALGVFHSAFNVAYAVVAVLSGALIFTSINLITAVSAFWIVENFAVTAVVFENHRFAYYPLTIYPRAFAFALTWVIPYGFASYYPASFLLGRDVGAMAWLGPVIAVTLTFIGYRLWLFGLSRYTSTGS
ncbi:MAG: ABC-2 family transporter protein [Anaerolineales bacterium]